MDEPITNGDEPRLVLTSASARVVLAETDAPGSLHYLLEAEGFQVVGCAADEQELGRVLGQGLRPDVIVLDADIVATSVLVAREFAPQSHVIAIWPDAVQPPPGGERLDPRLVYEELGPAIRRYMDRSTVPVPVVAMPRGEPAAAVGAAAVAATGADAASPVVVTSVFARTASRMSVLSVTLVTAILLTMGVSFALGGFRWHPADGPPRLIAPRVPDIGTGDTSDPSIGRVPPSVGGGTSGGKTQDHSGGGTDHHNASGGLGDLVVAGTSGGGGDGTPTEGGGSGDQGGSGQGDQGGGGDGDQGGGGEGGQGGGGGGGQGGGGQGDQGGGGQGDQGGGGQGDQGGGDGQHGGRGDDGGDDQGEDEQAGDQGDSQGDQDGDSEGDDSQGEHGPHGGDHGSHSDNQDGGPPPGDRPSKQVHLAEPSFPRGRPRVARDHDLRHR